VGVPITIARRILDRERPPSDVRGIFRSTRRIVCGPDGTCVTLRHQLQVLQRSPRPRVHLTPADRLLWVWLSRIWTEWRSAIVFVRPDTVIAWRRREFRQFWTWKSRRRLGRPAVPPDLRALIRRMSHANPLWGAPRMHGELLKLGIEVSQASVSKCLVRPRPPPSQSWPTFLANHVHQIMAADFFLVPTATGRLLFVLRHARAPAPACCACGGYSASDCWLDRAATSRGVPVERRTAVSDSRPGSRLRRRPYHRFPPAVLVIVPAAAAGCEVDRSGEPDRLANSGTQGAMRSPPQIRPQMTTSSTLRTSSSVRPVRMGMPTSVRRCSSPVLPTRGWIKSRFSEGIRESSCNGVNDR
jgi:hypothetical protein